MGIFFWVCITQPNPSRTYWARQQHFFGPRTLSCWILKYMIQKERGRARFSYWKLTIFINFSVQVISQHHKQVLSKAGLNQMNQHAVSSKKMHTRAVLINDRSGGNSTTQAIDYMYTNTKQNYSSTRYTLSDCQEHIQFFYVAAPTPISPPRVKENVTIMPTWLI